MRTRINDRLARATQYPVTLIVAPAGFGKSSALRDFVEAANIDALRFDVHRDDNSLLTFVKSFAHTLEPIAPSLIGAFPTIQESVLAAAEPVRQISDWFFEHIKRAQATIIIDDLHYAAADPASIALLADLIERVEDRVKWIIAARNDAGLPVGSWLAYGRMDLPIGEDELRFTTQEALAAADISDLTADAQEVESLRQLTEGWPVALTIALRTRVHSRDLRTASLGTREMVYRYLAEQVFNGLSETQRAFSLATCVLPSFDVDLAKRFGYSAALVQDVRAKIAFVNEVAPGQFRYHDLFRDFLETELRRIGERHWLSAICDAGKIVEERGDYSGALTLFTKAHATEQILNIVEMQGFALLERGDSERLASALATLSDEDLAAHAAALGLKAVIESGRGHFELVERSFRAAIDAAIADTELQLVLVYRYAIELVRHDRDSISFLEPYASQRHLPIRQRVPLLGTLATAYARSGREADAISTIGEALRIVDGSLGEEQLARLYQQAAFVYHLVPDTQNARKYAQAAIELAIAHNLYDVAARAYTVLFTIAYNENDDPLASLEILDRVEENAVKGASQQAHIFALVAAYGIEVDRGNEAALDRLDLGLRDSEGALPHARFETLAPSYALRAAWSRDFRRAYEVIRDTVQSLSGAERQALRAAEIALYAAASGESDAADDAAAACTLLLEHTPMNRRTMRARCFLAIAALVRGHEAAAHRILAEAERALTPAMRRLRALVQAARTAYQIRLGQADEQAMQGALNALTEQHFGGMAKLLAGLPLQPQDSSAISILTSAEREILQLLAKGASSKEVASLTGRSPHTVDTHIRSICRKLNCSGRREAVALATSQGWVQA